MKIQNATTKDIDFIDEQLINTINSNVPNLNGDAFTPIRKCIKDKDNNIVGGILGTLELKSALHINILWVDDNQRGNGLGKILLENLENEAISGGARFAYLETFDFQARGFYEKCGYEVFSQLVYPTNNTLYFMKRSLV